jgi:hypothetical protein
MMVDRNVPGVTPAGRGEFINIGNDCPIERQGAGDERLEVPPPISCYERRVTHVSPDLQMISGRDACATRELTNPVFSPTAQYTYNNVVGVSQR